MAVLCGPHPLSKGDVRGTPRFGAFLIDAYAQLSRQQSRAGAHPALAQCPD
jgi:hypothetical protein